MKLSMLKKASDIEVQEWLIETLNLTPDQSARLRHYELIRFSPYKFYKPKMLQTNILWRLTAVFYFLFWLILVLLLPINYIIVGRWGYSPKIDNLLYYWQTKICL